MESTIFQVEDIGKRKLLVSETFVLLAMEEIAGSSPAARSSGRFASVGRGLAS